MDFKLKTNSELYNRGIVATEEERTWCLRRLGAWEKLYDENCLQVSHGEKAKNHTNSLPTAEHLGWVARAWCILSAAEFQAMLFLSYSLPKQRINKR